MQFFVSWFDVLGVCLDEEVVVVSMLYSVARNFCFSRAWLGADVYGSIVNAHSGSSVQSYQCVKETVCCCVCWSWKIC